MKPSDYRTLVRLALDEDLGAEGDVTTAAIFGAAPERPAATAGRSAAPAGQPAAATGQPVAAARQPAAAHAVLTSKAAGVLAGAEVFSTVYEEVDEAVTVAFSVEDGAALVPGQVVARLAGPAGSILTGERVAINFLSFLSGIATEARRFSEAAAQSPLHAAAGREGRRAVILDTRKTLPGFRALSKYAVAVGGAYNHRQGLHDMVLIKDNHIDFAGSIANAVERVRETWADRFTVEVECRTLAEVEEALAARADIIMLDNMETSDIVASLQTVNGRAKIELSGNMDLKRVHELAGVGADYISVGRLTHSVNAFDFSLTVEIHHAG